MKEVASHYGGRPVAVFGLNVDRGTKDAQLVHEVMGLNYPTLLGARDLPPRCGVAGYPTVALIDKKGVLRKLHVGYSGDLKQALIRDVDALLAEDG